MTPKTRINRLLSQAMSRGRMSPVRRWMDRMAHFNDAFARGLILSRDGKELTPAKWLKTLPPYLAALIKSVSKPKRKGKADQPDKS